MSMRPVAIFITRACLVTLLTTTFLVASIWPSRATSPAVESSIVSYFDGLYAGNAYKLANGQVWVQTGPFTWMQKLDQPRVIVYQLDAGYFLKVMTIPYAVAVRRVK